MISHKACAPPSVRCESGYGCAAPDSFIGISLLRVWLDLHLSFLRAKRTVGYVPFDPESLVTGKLFEDIREAVHELANPTITTPSSSSIFACPPSACR